MTLRRVFLPKSEREEGRLRSVYRLTCRECGSQQPKLVCTAAGGAYPPEMIIKHMTNKGWEVGKRDGDDFCPACVNRKQEQRRKFRAFVTNEDQMGAAAQMKTTPKAEADKPREPNITEVLIILSKLDEVFDPKSGYLNGMTDARVAADLNCPRAWVADVRRNKFGEAGANDEIRELLAKVEELKTAFQTLHADCKAALAGFSDRQLALKADVERVIKRATEIETTIR